MCSTYTHTHTEQQAGKLSYILLYMQKSTYKCFIRKVIDNPKRRLLYQIVSVHSCPPLIGWGLHSPYWWDLESLPLSSSLQRNLLYYPVLRINFFHSSIKNIEKLFCSIKLNDLRDYIFYWCYSLWQNRCGKHKSIKIGCLPSLLFVKFLPEINTQNDPVTLI